jgi:hypothetical protein
MSGLITNLLSVSKMVGKGLIVTFPNKAAVCMMRMIVHSKERCRSLDQI